jgi:predicted RNase H-like HicB family nuclease
MRYKVRLTKTDEGYTVEVPDLPGCISEGNTEAEALDNIKDAIQEYLAAVADLRKLDGILEERDVEVVV